jgi:serum/glucocorticoid-regulated kinase 2
VSEDHLKEAKREHFVEHRKKFKYIISYICRDYLAPEIIQGSPHGKSVDWWGVGVLLYEMLTGQPPFRGKNRNELYEQVLKVDVIFPEHVSQHAKSLVTQLLCKKPEERLGAQGADSVTNHPFFKSIQWDKLLQKEVDPPFKPIVQPVQNGTSTTVEANITPQEVSQIMPSNDSTLSTSPSFQQFSYSSETTLSSVDD